MGSHSITAVYSGDGNHGASTSAVITQIVNKCPTVTVLTSSVNPSGSAQAVTFTATLTSTVSGTPSGSINFLDGSTVIGTGTLSVGGVVTLSTSTLPAGSHSITAVYSSDANFATSTSNAITQVVLKTPSVTVLASFVNPSAAGQSVSFSATVSSSVSGAPTGTVNFFDGTAMLGSGTLNAGGVATFAATLLPGSHSITATYAGESNFSASTSTAVTQVVAPAGTTVALTFSANPSNNEQSVTFTATVTSAITLTPIGSINFLDGTTLLGSGTLNGNGAATYSTSTLTIGTHSITAVYSGDTSFTGSTSAALSQVVNPADFSVTTTTPTQSANPGSSATYLVSVNPLNGVYNGTVTLTATGLPPSATYTFVPPTLSPGGSAASSTLTIQTPKLQTAANREPGFPRPLIPIAAGFMLLPFVGRRAMRRSGLSRYIQMLALLAISLAAAGGLTACGTGGFFLQSPKSYTVTITGTNGSVQHSTTVNLTVE